VSAARSRQYLERTLALISIKHCVGSNSKMGKVSGFDFYRDPLNADQPNVNPADIVRKESANKPNVMNAQRQLLKSRYIPDAKDRPDREDVAG